MFIKNIKIELNYLRTEISEYHQKYLNLFELSELLKPGYLSKLSKINQKL